MQGDTREQSLFTEEYEIECPTCDMVFNITVGESNYGGEGWIDELDDRGQVEVVDTPIND